ncbi:MAG TPA: DUF4126 family protein [Allosphingosinicella sp.]|nr:DUF4126 family protein [Allosphingosinicella sp.]
MDYLPYLLALLIGVVAGLRTMTAPAAICWAAFLGWFSLAGTPLAFMGSIWAVGAFTLLALLELVADQLPSTPSRKVPMQFGARLVTGGLSGAAIGAAHQMLVPGLVASIAGAVIGTYGGAALRAGLAKRFGRDLPAALVEDAIAIGGALLIVCHL